MGKIFKKIYEEVKKIPKGEVATYGEIARKVGTTPRVVGFALHRNPDPKNIPCHRVVFKNGSLAPGYLFGGKEKQKELLLSEGVRFERDKDDPCQRHKAVRRKNYNKVTHDRVRPRHAN